MLKEAPPSIEVDQPEDNPVSDTTSDTTDDTTSDTTDYEYTSTAATGPGVLLYAALPALGLLCKRNQNKHGER